ncbi:hypothetical protein SEA_LASTJEDI_84 [Mycobacterium phage LastJedi]|nr:hypothetical protein SEA_LASTJEDI_84 [Mycobacterium phage LastJedi]
MPSLGRQVKCAQSPKTSTGSGFYSFPGRPTMSTFPAPRTLTERIQGASPQPETRTAGRQPGHHRRR